MPDQKKRVRCAIYTRKSTEYGLEQEFNSLDAQREAAEAYIKSQAHEGWSLVSTQYDDGGLSGSSLERPALQALLSDVRDRKVDVIVVYKVDRLTRSLADFAKLVELFEVHGVSFVSVTQQFNTTSSMGRLTLNVLLSFAQFEREVTAERIRDKIAATKKKGIWIGGPVPLGYAVKDKKLVVVEDQAEQVRAIFRRYLELGSLHHLQRDLQTREIVSKRRTLSSGRVVGGTPYYVAGLSWLLKNRMYVGEINHKGKSYPAEHAPIVDPATFDAVQVMFSTNAVELKRKRSASDSVLIGKLFDDAGNRMSPVNTQKGPARYRYYVPVPLRRGVTGPVGSVRRVSAPDIERAVAAALAQVWQRRRHDPSACAPNDAALINEILERAVVSRDSVQLTLTVHVGAEPGESEVLVVPFHTPNWKPVREIVAIANDQNEARIRMRPSKRRRLVLGIAKARMWAEDLVTGRVANIEAISSRTGTSVRHVRMMISLAFLAPEVVAAAMSDELPEKFGLSRISDSPPISWRAQRSQILL